MPLDFLTTTSIWSCSWQRVLPTMIVMMIVMMNDIVVVVVVDDISHWRRYDDVGQMTVTTMMTMLHFVYYHQQQQHYRDCCDVGGQMHHNCWCSKGRQPTPLLRDRTGTFHWISLYLFDFHPPFPWWALFFALIKDVPGGGISFFV